MSHTVHWIDRLRIERVVWSLDQRLYDLPRRSRVAKRREVRENLLTASRDVGTTSALRQLGDPRRLALDYLAAEFGDEARPHWTAAAFVLATVPFLLTPLLTEAANAFAKGVLAGDPAATGRYTWDGIAVLQEEVQYRFTGGTYEYVGGAFTPWTWGLLFLAAVLAGRRAVPMWRRRRHARLASPEPTTR